MRYGFKHDPVIALQPRPLIGDFAFVVQNSNQIGMSELTFP